MALLRRTIGLIALVVGLIALGSLLESRRDPDVRRARLPLAHWPRGAPTLRVALMSDIHIGNASMTAARLERIVDRVNAEHPDLIVIAGDFIAGEVPGSAKRLAPRLIAPLRRLRAPLGIVAVPGNHDHATGLPAVNAALARAGVRMLVNQPLRRGPITLIGLDGDGHAPRPEDAAKAAGNAGGALIGVAHYPQMAAALPPGVPLLAAHTHCGQIVLPVLGPLVLQFRPEMEVRCGIVRFADHVAIISGGLGTSGAPFRIGAPPDFWIVTLGPAAP
ncbi:MAG: metallophosphoesterase [Sphingomonas sp.]